MFSAVGGITQTGMGVAAVEWILGGVPEKMHDDGRLQTGEPEETGDDGQGGEKTSL